MSGRIMARRPGQRAHGAFLGKKRKNRFLLCLRSSRVPPIEAQRLSIGRAKALWRRFSKKMASLDFSYVLSRSTPDAERCDVRPNSALTQARRRIGAVNW